MKLTDLEFIVVRQPRRGRLVRHENNTALPVIQFDVEDLTAGRIVYEHDQASSDGGAATVDAFTVIARLSLRAKRSEPRTVHVAVAARNVAPPNLTNNRPLKVNIGSIKLYCRIILSNSDLPIYVCLQSLLSDVHGKRLGRFR